MLVPRTASLAAVTLAAAALATACRRRGDAAHPPPAPIVINTTVAAPPPAGAEPDTNGEDRAAYIRAHYTKYEYRIPMRDGARLFTSVYLPLDAGPARKYPILLERTPYSVAPYGADRYADALGPTAAFEKAGYIFVDQDVRGTYMSEGDYVNVRPQLADPRAGGIDESTDTFDTITWLLAHVPGHNGKVGQWGVSYPGFYTWTGALSRHPALVAVSPQAPVIDWWQGDDMHRHGCFALQEAFTFFAAFGRPRPHPVADEGKQAWPAHRFGTPDAYRYFLDLGPLSEVDAADLGADIPFWHDLVDHPDDDDWWKARDLRPHLRDVKAAVLVVGGWYDTENLFGALESYQAITRQSPRTPATLIMGPWRHGFWNGDRKGDRLGDASFGFTTTAVYQDLVLAFFEHHLKGAAAPDLPEALVFESGANRWRRFDAWPPPASRPATLYLQPDGGLGFSPPPPQPARAEPAPAYDEYVSDPMHPVPYTLDNGSSWHNADYMAEDQRPFSRRPDVLVYETPPLDHDVTLAGPLDAELYVSTTGSDADWVVKLVDVNPGILPGVDPDDASEASLGGEPNRGGQETLVRGEPFRGRYRDGGEHGKPFTPGEITPIRFTIDDVFHTFGRGHRIQIEIQSTWFPFIDRNPQTFVASIFAAKRSDFIKATHRVYRSLPQASAIHVRVLPSADEPK